MRRTISRCWSLWVWSPGSLRPRTPSRCAGRRMWGAPPSTRHRPRDAGDQTNTLNRGSSALKLTLSGRPLRVASYFTPFNYQFLNDNDLDYGGMGALLIPGSTST